MRLIEVMYDFNQLQVGNNIELLIIFLDLIM